MPLGSSSAAPVIRPGPSCLRRGAPCRRPRRPDFGDLSYSRACMGIEEFVMAYYNARRGQKETSMTRYFLTALLICAAAPAFAQQPDAPKPIPSGPACLRPINLYSFAPVSGNRSLIVTDQARQRY